MNQFNILTIYPDFFESFSKYGLIKKALDKKIIEINTIDLRLHTQDRHNRVDFKTYGGGPGMVIQYQPVRDALKIINSEKCYFLSPQGERLSQKKLINISEEKNITFLCGRYEGVDQRVIDNLVDEEISIGDFILSGGEFAALTLIDSFSRFILGVIGNEKSVEQDSFSDGLLKGPVFTRPENFNSETVPDILMSGDHKKIKEWRENQSLIRTFERRPELLKNEKLTKKQKKLLEDLASKRIL